MKYSNTPSAIKSRLRRLPKLMKDHMVSARKRDAKECIQYFQSGLLNNEFKLTPLSPRTIEEKIRLGCSKPSSPLYRMGFDQAHTYVKGLRYFKTSNGYVVRMTGRHYDGKIDNHTLLMIHEYGCTLKNGGRIPARPALREAYNKTLKNIQARDGALKKIIEDYLRTGKWNAK